MSATTMPEIHPGNLLALAADPAKMAALKGALDQALATALAAQGRSDTGDRAAVIGLVKDSQLKLTVEFVDPVAQARQLWPVLRSIDVVAGAIYLQVQDTVPDDDAEFDQVVAVARQALQKRDLHPGLAPFLVETALAAIHPERFADRMVCTLYKDGRLMVLTTALLCRLLQDPRRLSG